MGSIVNGYVTSINKRDKFVMAKSEGGQIYKILFKDIPGYTPASLLNEYVRLETKTPTTARILMLITDYTDAKEYKKVDRSFLYQTPKDVFWSKGNDVKGWEVLERSNWTIYASGRGDPANVREELKSNARIVGANAVVNIDYFTTTGSESGTGRGTHYYTIHNYCGQPVNIGKKSDRGIPRSRAITNINNTAENLKIDFNKQRSMYRKIGTFLGILLAGLIAYTYYLMPGDGHFFWYLGEFFAGSVIYGIWSSDPGEWLQPR